MDMIPFKVFDKERQEIWVVLNHHSGSGAGSYLIAREDDEERDFEMKIIPAEALTQFRFLDFLEEESVID